MNHYIHLLARMFTIEVDYRGFSDIIFALDNLAYREILKNSPTQWVLGKLSLSVDTKEETKKPGVIEICFWHLCESLGNVCVEWAHGKCYVGGCENREPFGDSHRAYAYVFRERRSVKFRAGTCCKQPNEIVELEQILHLEQVENIALYVSVVVVTEKHFARSAFRHSPGIKSTKH